MERLLLLVGLTVVSVVGYMLMRRWQLWRVGRLAWRETLPSDLRSGVPAVIYFTTPGCMPCQTQQKPALRALQNTLGEEAIQVIEINALEQPETADRWGVLSVPTTFVLDRQGQPRDVNHGVADAAKLQQQLQRLGKPRVA